MIVKLGTSGMARRAAEGAYDSFVAHTVLPWLTKQGAMLAHLMVMSTARGTMLTRHVRGLNAKLEC